MPVMTYVPGFPFPRIRTKIFQGCGLRVHAGLENLGKSMFCHLWKSRILLIVLEKKNIYIDTSEYQQLSAIPVFYMNPGLRNKHTPMLFLSIYIHSFP